MVKRSGRPHVAIVYALWRYVLVLQGRLQSVASMLLSPALMRRGAIPADFGEDGALADAEGQPQQIAMPPAWAAAQQAGGLDILQTLTAAGSPGRQTFPQGAP